MTVFGIIALAIPKIKRPVLMPGGAEWKNKRIKNEMAVTAIPGTNNFKLYPFLFATVIPIIGPKIMHARPKDNCKNPVWSGSNPNPDGGGEAPNCGVPVITIYSKIPYINIMMFPVTMTLLNSNFKLTNGGFTRFSTIMKSTRNIIPIIRDTANGVKLVAIDPINVIAKRKLTIVTVSVPIPI
jgi:hypothetical protein